MRQEDGARAAWYRETLPGAGIEGRLELTAEGVRLRCEQGVVELPFTGIEARLGGFDDRTLFLAHPSRPGEQLASADPLLLEALRAVPEIAAAIGSRRRHRRRFWALWVAALAALTALLGIGALAWKGIVAAIVDRVPPELERRVGDAALTAFGLGEEDRSPALEELARPLTASSDLAWRFFLVEDDTVNAFALPGGAVAVHCGLVVELLSGQALRGVLAHEVAHAEARHGLRAVVGEVGLRAALALLIGDPAGLEGLLLGAGTELASLAHSRALEEAADDRGGALLAAAGLDPHDLVAALERLAELESGASLPPLLSSHPDPGDRARRLASRWPRAERGAEVAAEAWRELRQTCGDGSRRSLDGVD